MSDAAMPPPDQDRATAIATALEQVVGVMRRLGAPGLSLSSVGALSTLEQSGALRITELAAREGVTQPAMTQLVARLTDAGLVTRDRDPDDGRAVRVAITSAGRAALAHRRGTRAERLTAMLAQLTDGEAAALGAAIPALERLARLAIPPLPAGKNDDETEPERPGG